MAFRIESLSSERFKGALSDFERYQIWRTARAEEAINHLNTIFPVSGKQFLDFGCGYGNLSGAIINHGAKVIPVEVDPVRIKTAKKQLAGYANPILISPSGLPIKNDSLDGVISMDVMEHVDPAHVSKYVSEAFRVLKPNGIFYAEMTPYYSFAGHHLLQYTSLPIHLFLPKDVIKSIVYGSKRQGFKTTDEIWQQFETLNKVHISEIQNTLRDYKIDHEGFIFRIPGFVKMTIPLLGRLGGLGEFFSLSYEVVARKRLVDQKSA